MISLHATQSNISQFNTLQRTTPLRPAQNSARLNQNKKDVSFGGLGYDIKSTVAKTGMGMAFVAVAAFATNQLLPEIGTAVAALLGGFGFGELVEAHSCKKQSRINGLVWVIEKVRKLKK